MNEILEAIKRAFVKDPGEWIINGCAVMFFATIILAMIVGKTIISIFQ